MEGSAWYSSSHGDPCIATYTRLSIAQEQQERDDEGDYEYYGGSWGYGYTFYYEDGNPYYVADMEERWENQMRFPPTMSSAKRPRGIWEGSLQVEGPCHQLDPSLLSAQSLRKWPRLIAIVWFLFCEST